MNREDRWRPRRGWRHCICCLGATARKENGEATIEFVAVTVGLLLPLLYLLVASFQVQAGLYAAEAGAAQAARILTEHPQSGLATAELAVQLAASDQGIAPGNAHFDLECAELCPASGASGNILVRVEVPLPLWGSVLGGVLPTEIPLQVKHPIQWGAAGA